MGFYLHTMKDSLEKLYDIFLKHPEICTNSRNIPYDSLFFALKGGSFNGNKFAEAAIKGGAAYAVVDEEKYAIDDRFLLVENSLETLQALSTYHRSKLDIPVIAVTGTNGKTTTKELIQIILSKKYTCYFS